MKLLLIILFIGLVTAKVIPENSINSITWALLSEYNIDNGHMSNELNALNNTTIEITGFIVPLEMDESIDKVSQFFLVPDPLSCIHIPPPPANQIIFVQLKESIPVDMDFRGISVTGILSFNHSANEGISYYELQGDHVKEGEIDYESPWMDSYETIPEHESTN